MIDKQKLKPILEGYKAYFPDNFDREKYKLIAVKTFKDNWNIDADDFKSMWKKATSKTSDLLAAYNFYPADMISKFATADEEATRELFRELYDESQDLSMRIDSFRNTAEQIQSKNDDGTWKNNYQNTNAISTYLWLRYPDKYYIYKYELFRAVAIKLSEDYMPARTSSPRSVIDGFRMYDEICEELKKDEELLRMFHEKVTPECYPDPEYRTMTIDFGFYVGRYYGKDSEGWEGTDFSDLFSVDEWIDLLQDRDVFTDGSLQIMKRMKDIGGTATCSQLSMRYGDVTNFYNSGSTYLARRISQKTGCSVGGEKNGKFWPILYLGKPATGEERGVYAWRLRDELSEAIDQINLDNVQLFATRGNIDYVGILEYLDKNRDVAVSEKALTFATDLPDEAYEPVLRGRQIVQELEKIAKYCAEEYGLDECAPITWLDGTGRKTSRYLQVVLKKKEYRDSRIQIKVVAEYDPEHQSYYRVSLDIDNDDAEAVEMNRYHSFLESFQENSKLCLTGKRNEWGNPTVLNEPVRDVRTKVQNGTYSKVQLSALIYRQDYKSATEIGDRVMEAIESILPYYENSEDNVSNTEGGTAMKYDKNMILYGPPGTGKTYSSAIYAVAICDNLELDKVKAWPYADVMKRYKTLKDEGRIVFTTFHQSYGYEEFIEGIKPRFSTEDNGDLQYRIEDGVFKKFCAAAEKKKVVSQDFEVAPDAITWKVTLQKGVTQDCFDKDRIRIDFPFEEYGAQAFRNDIKRGDFVVTTDGTRTKINGIAVVTGDDAYEIDEETDKTTRSVKWLAKAIDVDFTSMNSGKLLHRATVARAPYCKPEDLVAYAKSISHEMAGTAVSENTVPYVFIIDEINRGNISKIFGELITLIEDTKRKGCLEALSVTLPYSGDTFCVPNNVYIIGTMNTADRSIALMDTALRRRFRFVEDMPDANVLRTLHANFVGTLDVAKMLEVINERITVLYDREHTIGHAYFIPLKDDPTIQCLGNIFEKAIIPLLQEYFYEDYEKIRLVLGDNAKSREDIQFITKDTGISGVFKGGTPIDIDAKYSINEKAFKNIESYLEIM